MSGFEILTKPRRKMNRKQRDCFDAFFRWFNHVWCILANRAVRVRGIDEKDITTEHLCAVGAAMTADERSDLLLDLPPVPRVWAEEYPLEDVQTLMRAILPASGTALSQVSEVAASLRRQALVLESEAERLEWALWVMGPVVPDEAAT